MFERLYIEISNICNLQCEFCPVVERDKKIMSVQHFREIAMQAQPLTKQVCLHLMGEPLGHPQFKEILQICDELNLRVFLTTNGTLIKKQTETLLNFKGLDQVNFSVHSFFANQKKYSLEEYLRPILEFCELAKEKDFYINLRLWNLENHQEQLNSNLQVFEHLKIKWPEININPQIDVKLNKSKKLFHKTYLHFDTEFEWPTLKREVISKEGTCYGLRKQLAIHANGDVVPCCLDKEAILKLGNFHEMKKLMTMQQNNEKSDSYLKSPSFILNEILKTDRAKKIKTGFEQGQLCEELCQKCQYVDRFRK